MSRERHGGPPKLKSFEICPVHHKRIYKRPADAAAGASQLVKRKGGHARFYECSIGKGYHLTHKTEAEYQAARDEWESQCQTSTK